MARPRVPRRVGVYLIRCRTTGHVYVGGSVNLKAREREHWTCLKEGRSHNRVLQFAWDVFGADDFTFEVVEECAPEMLDEREYHHLRSRAEPLFNLLKDPRNPRSTLTAAGRQRRVALAKKQHAQGNLGRKTWRKS